MTVTTVAPLPARAFAEHEHRDLTAGINRLHEVACGIGRTATPDLKVHVLSVLHWLDRTLEPHVAWEEGWLYPEVDARSGSPWATRAARFDHGQIRELIGRIRADREALGLSERLDRHEELRCHLFGLEALLRAHIEREERFLIPLLDEPSASVPTA
jgi:iron-sulfur cluster repair protein YtfE (RIC family)